SRTSDLAIAAAPAWTGRGRTGAGAEIVRTSRDPLSGRSLPTRGIGLTEAIGGRRRRCGGGDAPFLGATAQQLGGLVSFGIASGPTTEVRGRHRSFSQRVRSGYAGRFGAAESGHVSD